VWGQGSDPVQRGNGLRRQRGVTRERRARVVGRRWRGSRTRPRDPGRTAL